MESVFEAIFEGLAELALDRVMRFFPKSNENKSRSAIITIIKIIVGIFVIALYFAHDSPTYGSAFDMMKQFGISYRTAGENIAMGQTTPNKVMEGWMKSPGHRDNILKPDFKQLGVGIAKNSKGELYCTQMFIG